MVDVPEYIRALKAYVAGKPIDELAREKNLKRIVKLASNENPLGPSPKALLALENISEDAHRYVDPSSHRLVQAIAKKYAKSQHEIVCGHGTDSILAYIVNAFTDHNDEVLTSEGTFIGIYVNVLKFGRKLVKVPLKDYGYDLDAIASVITEKTKLIYLANPNNPTGTMFSKAEFEKFMSAVPDSILVILDEAYTVYAEENSDYPNGFEYDYQNLIVTRTFSKAYGLAGLRVGFAVAPTAVIKEIYKVKLPFEPNYPAQIAAEAALDDDDFLKQTVETNKTSLAKLKACFNKLGIKQIPTAANFIMILFASEQFATAFNEECLEHGLIVRHVKSFGIPEAIRINSGTEAETEFAVSVIEKVYQALSEKFGIENKKAVRT